MATFYPISYPAPIRNLTIVVRDDLSQIHSCNHSWLENGPNSKMYFLLKMRIFQPAMLVYQRVAFSKLIVERFQGKF